MSTTANPLLGVEAYVFDVFGTVVNWYDSVTRALEKAAPDGHSNEGKFTSSSAIFISSSAQQIGAASRKNGERATKNIRT